MKLKLIAAFLLAFALLLAMIWFVLHSHRTSFYLHKKSGNMYKVLGECRLEATGERDRWVRPYNEFMDGRFTHISGPMLN